MSSNKLGKQLNEAKRVLCEREAGKQLTPKDYHVLRDFEEGAEQLAELDSHRIQVLKEVKEVLKNVTDKDRQDGFVDFDTLMPELPPNQFRRNSEVMRAMAQYLLDNPKVSGVKIVHKNDSSLPDLVVSQNDFDSQITLSSIDDSDKWGTPKIWINDPRSSEPISLEYSHMTVNAVLPDFPSSGPLDRAVVAAILRWDKQFKLLKLPKLRGGRNSTNR